MKLNKSYDIPRYFLCKITHFHSVLFNCNALLAFRDFVLWQTKFFCLLLYRFAFRWHRQIFCHSQMKGNLPNIADTYLTLLVLLAGFGVCLFFGSAGSTVLVLSTLCPCWFSFLRVLLVLLMSLCWLSLCWLPLCRFENILKSLTLMIINRQR